MADEDALSAEMRRLLHHPDGPDGPNGSDPLALDQDTAERLLSGRLDPADTPPAYARVAEVLAAAAGPSTVDELAGAPSVLAAFKAAHPPASLRAEREGARGRAPAARGRPATGRRLRAGLAALAVAAALSVGGTAAALTGNLPAPVQRLARVVLPGAAAPTSDHRTDGTAPQTTGGTSGTTGATVPPGAAALTGPAARSLCTAWSAGKGENTGTGGQLSAEELETLAAAATGADQIPAYCERIAAAPPSSAPGQGQPGAPAKKAGPTAAALHKLCKTYLKDKQRTQLSAEELETLAAAAGGADQIPAYCERIAG